MTADIINSVIYAAFFEAQVHSAEGKPIGKILKLSDPDVFPGKSDKEAIIESFRRVEITEYLKSLRITRRENNRRFRVRLAKVVRRNRGAKDEIIFTPKYKKGEFK